jgi:hypothetical protein
MPSEGHPMLCGPTEQGHQATLWVEKTYQGRALRLPN